MAIGSPLLTIGVSGCGPEGGGGLVVVGVQPDQYNPPPHDLEVEIFL